jgi:surface polysaccharide O-acyltransferase-like enzyme
MLYGTHRTRQGYSNQMVPSERSAATARLDGPAGPSVSPVLMDPGIPRVQPVPAPLSLPSERLASIDLLRIMAVVGIIWFHTGGAPYVQIGYAGLPMFLLIYFSLVTKQSRLHATSQFLRRRWDRLLKPWLFWSVVYGVCRLVKAAYTMDVSSIERMLSLETVLVGTSIHLWYLPYAFASGLFIHVLNRRTVRISDTLVVLAAALTGAFVLAACTVGLHAYELARPLPQWEFGLAAIPLGLAIGRSLAIPSRRVQMLLLSVICATTLGTCAILTSFHLDSTAIPYGLAMVFVCLAYGWQVNGNGLIATLAPLTFGIYLLHPLVMYGLPHFLAAQGHHAAFIALTACISSAVTWGLMQTPLRRFV